MEPTTTTPTTTYSSRINSYRSLKLLCLSCIIFFCLMRCNRGNEQSIQLANNIFLFQGEENSNGGFSIALKEDSNFFRPLVEQNPIKIYYKPSVILVAQIDNSGLKNYFKIKVNKGVKDCTQIIDLKEAGFYKEVRNCFSCKEIELTLDTARGRWAVKK